MENVKYRICYWYHEYQDMSASVPTCDYYRKYGECPCEPECKHFINKREVDDIVRNMGKIGQMSDLISRQDAIKPFCVAPDGTRIPEVDCDNFSVEFSVEFIKKHLLSLPSIEPRGDLISREDAIKAVCGDCLREYEEDKCEHENECSMKKALVELPSAEAEWIPCSEKLPSVYGEYLATVDGETIEVSYVPETKGLVKGWSTCDAYGYKRLSDDDVIAWMPLPKPYREDGE